MYIDRMSEGPYHISGHEGYIYNRRKLWEKRGDKAECEVGEWWESGSGPAY